MSQRRPRPLRGIAAAALLLLGCGGGESGPSTGLHVAVSTTGTEIDQDGYGIQLDGAAGGTVGPSGALVLAAAAGSHVVTLAGIAGNCSVTGDSVRTVTVADGEVAQVAFALTCVASGLDARSIAVGPPGVALVPGEELRLEVVLYDAGFNPVGVASRARFIWTTNAPGLASVSDTGLVTVPAGATPGQFALITVAFDSLQATAQISISPPTTAVAVRPSPIGLTPGGRHILQGLVRTDAGDFFPGYYVRFSLPTTSVAHLTPQGCGRTDCVYGSTWETLLTADAPGTATLAVAAAGQQTTVPVTVAYAAFDTVTAGGEHTCGRATTGVLYCWGGLVGPTPLAAGELAGLRDIQAGVDRTCGLDAAGLAQCLGDTLGAVPTQLSATLHFSTLALTSAFSCGLDLTGAAWCWGNNESGELGDGSQTPSATPVAVAGGHTFAALAAGGSHACGLTMAGAAWCWGFSFAGEVGATLVPPSDPCSPYACFLEPVAVQGAHAFTRIVAGAHHTCALDAGGAAWCWGFGDKLGAGPRSDIVNNAPVAVAGELTLVQLTARGDHTCGLTADGLAYCWGANPDGRTGQPAGDSPVLTPTLVAGNHTFSQLSAGGVHTCGIATDGLYCWGGNGQGEIGVAGGATDLPVKPVGQP
ncbi:MAG TPA: hypothetical protein VFG66_12075 [Gemmatimonadales bacterium]|nr:hypothetical protein [Gemmatimonadales bacterium]